jgi:ATP synthase F1 delta subunit
MEEIAQVYARSLFEVAKEQGSLDRVRDEIGEFADAVNANHEVAIFFFSPYFSTEEKKDGLRRMISGADPIVLNLLSVLVENHRMPVIFRLRRALDKMWEQENKRLPVQITSAVELDHKTIKHLRQEIERQTGQQVQLTEQVDPSVLGGIVLRVGNSILDASIRNRLEQMRKQVAKA